ncbi:uncharacterized protein [Palaemon carinicauda]|uniref:uncharacterized protein n=1 Tax=Palaemon carinicauda TaxID=392227 RepID=UPI0035B5E7EE
MSDQPHTEAPPRRSSLRARPQRIDYSEDEFEDDIAKGREEKKRGSKRKAEVNIESLYCQENAKDVCVCPSLLETIFESPVKGANRCRSKNARAPGKVSETESQLQMMSVKKWKRFCAFADYYHPSKHKVKVRKDRAKKMKQLTGVKIPKGVVSDDALKTILAVLSDEDDQNENIQSTHSCKSSSSFYIGNIIKPDIEDSSLNDMIRNISSMKMTADSSEEGNIPHNALMEDIEPLPFTDEKQNTLPAVSHQKKSRRRSEKFSGILLPRPLTKMDEEFEDLPVLLKDDEDKSLGLARIAIEGKSNYFEPDERTEVKIAPKRRSVLNDKKIVKKTKHQELTLKRQSESKDDQCQKKRGDMKFSVVKDDSSRKLDEHVIGNNLFKKTNAIKFDVESSSGIADMLSCREISLAQKQSNSSFQSINLNKSGFGKKPGKRRVSGVKRPLYRKIIEISSPEVLKTPNQSPNIGSGRSSPFSCFNTSSEELNEGNPDFAVVDVVGQNTLKTSHSPTSPCTQMAALSLQSERESEFNLMQKNLKFEGPRRITRRRSAQLARAPLFSPLSSNNPSSPLSSAISDGERNRGLSSVYNDLCGSKNEYVKGTSDEYSISQEVCDSSSNVLSHSDPKAELMAGLITSKKGSVKKNKGHSVGLASTKGSSCRTSEKVKSTCESNDTNDSPPENGTTYLSLKENIAVDMLSNRGQISSQMLQNGNVVVTNTINRLTPVNHESSVDIKRSENVCNNAHQPSVKIDGESCEVDFISKSLFVIDEHFDSPVITGMIGNKANIRKGKIYRNRLSSIESPIILAQLDKRKSKEILK